MSSDSQYGNYNAYGPGVPIVASGNSIFPPQISNGSNTGNPQSAFSWSEIKRRFFGSAGQSAADAEMDRPLAEQTIVRVAETWGLDIDLIQRGAPWRRMAWYDNPDLNIRNRAFTTYDTMMLDSQVRTAINSKRFAVISADWEIVPASDAEQDKEIAEFVTWCFWRCRGTIQTVIFELLNAIVHGYAIAEMNFKPITAGRWAGKWGLESCPAKNPLDYEFQIDPCGRVESLYLGYRSPIANLHLPLDKFLIYTYQPQYDRVYGRSDLQGCYWDWWFKQRIEKLRGIYLERYSIPLMHGKVPTAQKALLRELKKALKNLGGQDNLVITPSDVEITLISDGKQQTDAFDNTVNYYNSQIVKTILGQTLTSGEGDRSGSMALGNVHAEQQEDWVTFLRNDISEFLTERTIRTLVGLNYNVSEFPRFNFVPRREKMFISTAAEFKALTETGILVEDDANIFRTRLGLPKLEKYVGSQEPLKVTLPVGAGGGGVPSMGFENPAGNENQNVIRFAWHDKAGSRESFAKSARRTIKASEMYACEKRVGGVEYYERAIKRVEKYQDEMIGELSPLIKSASQAILNYYQTKVANPAEAAVSESALRDMAFPAKIKKQMTATAKKLVAEICYNEYVGMLAEQGIKKGVPEIPKEKYARRTDVTLQTVPDAAAIKKMQDWNENEDWNKAREWRAKQIASVAGTNETKVDFYVTGIIEQNCLKDVKVAIFNGMRSGQSIDAISKNIGDVFKQYGSDPKVTRPDKLEMIARTNINNAIADARLEAARDPVVMDAFPALMFSALMEAGTCDECAALDGSVYAVDDPIWNTITPCIHPNCNCWVIAVSADEYRESGDSEPPDVEAISARKGV